MVPVEKEQQTRALGPLLGIVAHITDGAGRRLNTA